MEALKIGKHVVLSSTGISLKEEIELKRAAEERGLLMLGPGCGTSILNGEGFGVWNSVSRGPIGIIGTFGSGIQQVACLVEKIGVSHALDVGFRDLSQSVKAAGMISALKFLEADAKTKVIALLSRTPVTSVKQQVIDAARRTGKPTVLCFLGDKARSTARSGLVQAKNFEDAAIQAVALLKMRGARNLIPKPPLEELKKIAEREYERFGYGQKYIRGVYSGGALCTEAMTVVGNFVKVISSNIPLEPRLRLPDPHSSKGHAFVDFGAEELTREQRPAVNVRPRCERIGKEAKDWETAVVLLDVILGNGAHPNPSEELAQAINKAKHAEIGGGYLSVIASIIGTPNDPQNLTRQREQLERAGAVVMPSNAQAARIASIIATKGRIWKKIPSGY